jgi:hypothetical protein
MSSLFFTTDHVIRTTHDAQTPAWWTAERLVVGSVVSLGIKTEAKD